MKMHHELQQRHLISALLIAFGFNQLLIPHQNDKRRRFRHHDDCWLCDRPKHWLALFYSKCAYFNLGMASSRRAICWLECVFSCRYNPLHAAYSR